MRAIIILTACIAFFFSNTYAQGWLKFYSGETHVTEFFELNDSTFLSICSSKVIALNNLGDVLWVNDSIGDHHAVRTPDGGYIVGMKKVSADFEVEWIISSADIVNSGIIGEIIPYPGSSGSSWYYIGTTSPSFLYGDATIPLVYPCIWRVNANGTHSSQVTVLAALIDTYDWENYDGYIDNDIVTKIGDTNHLMALANCNAKPCLIDVNLTAFPPVTTKTCYTPERLISLIHASDQSGYVMAGKGACLLKTNLVGNQQWLKFFTDGPFSQFFNEVIATTDGGYIAVGQGAANDDIFVVKTDINGNLQWQIKGLGFDGTVPNSQNHTREMATAVIQTSDGGYLIGGYIEGQYLPSSGEPDPYFNYPFFLKIDSTGNCRPSAGFTHSVADYNLSITANTTFGADSYLWQFGNGDTSNLAMPAYTYPQPGSYNLCLIARNLCGNDTLCTAVDIATGIAQNAGSAPLQLRLYPNPVQGGGGAFWQLSSLPVGSAAVLKVYNHLGQLVYSCVVASGAAQGMLPVAQWQAGTYWVQLTTPGHALTQKMAVVR